MTTIASDWDDIDAVVDYIRKLRGVERVSLVGWSLGGPRAGGYAAQPPDKVGKLVLLAPAYNRDDAPPIRRKPCPAAGAAFNTQSHADFDGQLESPSRLPRAVRAGRERLGLGRDACIGPGRRDLGPRRAPRAEHDGVGLDAGRGAARRDADALVTGVHDKQVAPERVRELYEDLGAQQKVLVDSRCSSHNAMWERNHLMLFRASLEWLTAGTVEGMQTGVVRLGY